MGKKKRVRGRAKRSSGKTSRGKKQIDATDLPILQKARALWQQNKLFDAVALFEQAVAKHPKNLLAVTDASRALGAVYRISTAEALLAQARDDVAGDARALQMIGQSFRLLRRPAQAIDCFEAAVAANPHTADSLLELAILHEQLGNLDAAYDAIRRRLKQIDVDPEGSVVAAKIQRRRGDLEAAERRLRRVADATTVHWITRSRAYGELASLLDSRGEYDLAWQAAVAGKQLGRPHASEALARRQQQIPRLRQLAEELTADHFNAWKQDEADDPDAAKNVLLTGMPRSGTTLLERMLNGHEQVIGCDEVDVFPRFMIPMMLGRVPLVELNAEKLCDLSEDRLWDVRRQYRNYMSEALGQPLAGKSLVDKNPSLLPVVTLYRRLLPASRLIVCLRDPRDVLVSCMLTYFPMNDFSVDLLELETATDRLVSDLQTWLTLRDKIGSRWHEVRYEQLVTDTRRELTGALAAIDLAWSDEVERNRLQGTTEPVYSPSYVDVSQPIYDRAVSRWKNYERHITPALPTLEPIIEKLGYGRV